MNRAYAALAAGIVLLALIASALARAPHRAPTVAQVALPPARVAVRLALTGGRVEPARCAVPKGRVVNLEVENRGPAPVRFELAGYGERVRTESIAPRARWRTEFTADLPGEDFAWLVDGQPAGVFAVTGSHLVEGHR